MDQRIGEFGETGRSGVPSVEPAPSSYGTQAGSTGEIASSASVQAQRVGRAASGRLMRLADQRKSFVASEVDNIAGTIDRLAGELRSNGRESQSRFMESASGYLHSASSRLSQNSSEQLFDDAERAIKSRPAAFLGGCFFIGFLAARLLRS